MTEEQTIGAHTIADFCSTYQIGRTRAYQEIKSGNLSASKIGVKTLILKSEAARWALSLPKLITAKAA